MASGTIDSLTHRKENDFLQTADHGPLDAQDRDVVLADLRRDLCGVWNIHLPRRYWQCGANDKVDEMVMALLHLTIWEEAAWGARA